MTAIALFGAGGKMGYRLASNLRGSRFSVRHVEVSDVGKGRLKSGFGIDTISADAALQGAEVVILAVPDTHIGKVAAGISGKLRAGTMVVALDAAAPFAGHLPARPDLTYFVTHPCHPPISNDETDMAAKHDHFGGVSGHPVAASRHCREWWLASRRSPRVRSQLAAAWSTGWSRKNAT
jgi:D-apionate oxidoisomerase